MSEYIYGRPYNIPYSNFIDLLRLLRLFEEEHKEEGEEE